MLCTQGKHVFLKIELMFVLFLKELDLTNPKTFRNLAKPMGAQTEDRLAQYKKRYKDWEDPNGKKWYILQEEEPATVQEDVVNFNYMTQDFWVWVCRALPRVF